VSYIYWSEMTRFTRRQQRNSATLCITHKINHDWWVKLLNTAGSAAVLFNGVKESWRLARKILSQFKLLWFLNVFWQHITRHSPLGNSKKNFLLPAALSNLTRLQKSFSFVTLEIYMWCLQWSAFFIQLSPCCLSWTIWKNYISKEFRYIMLLLYKADSTKIVWTHSRSSIR